MEKLFTLDRSGIYQIAPGQLVMILVGLLLLYLAINRGFEPLLLVPIGFGGILALFPAPVWHRVECGVFCQAGSAAGLATALQLTSWETGKDILLAYEASGSMRC